MIATIAGLILLASLILFLESASSLYMSEKSKEMVTWQIRAAPKLPQNFVDFYSAIYPEQMKEGFWGSIKNHIIHRRPGPACPCEQAVKMMPRSTFDSPETWNYIRHSIIALKVEELLSQEDCLNFTTHSSDFLNGQMGIQAASEFYLKKKLADLNQREMAELIARMKNPVFYDREKNSWNLNRKINLILDEINPDP